MRKVFNFLLPALLALAGCEDGQQIADTKEEGPCVLRSDFFGSSERLRAALAQERESKITALNIGVTTTIDESRIANGTFVPVASPCLKLLGGRHAHPETAPFSRFEYPQAITMTPAQFDSSGFSKQRAGLMNGLAFVLPAGVDAFEVEMFDSGRPGNIVLEVDGDRTNDAGYDSGYASTGKALFTKFELRPSGKPRRIRLITNGRPIAGIRLPAGFDLDTAPMAGRAGATMMFIGDSITEGSVSSHVTKAWAFGAAERLGIDHPIIAGIGGTGYIRKRGDQLNFGARPEDVLEAVDGGPPDALVVAGGINDCGVNGYDYAPEEIGAAALSYFAKLRRAAPEMPIFVLGPFSYYDGVPYPAHLRQCRSALFGAANDVDGIYTVDTGDWVTTANRDTVFDDNRNGPHPIDSGHRIYAERAAAAIRPLIAAFE